MLNALRHYSLAAIMPEGVCYVHSIRLEIGRWHPNRAATANDIMTKNPFFMYCKIYRHSAKRAPQLRCPFCAMSAGQLMVSLLDYCCVKILLFTISSSAVTARS